MHDSAIDRDIEELADGVTLVRWDPMRPRPAEPGVIAPVANFGDLLGPVVVRRLVELSGAHGTAGSGRLLSVGSVLHFARPGDVVWGTGVNGKISMDGLLDAGSLDVRATRGPFSAAILGRNGHAVPAVHGDPALLLPELFPEVAEWATRRTARTTIVPNFNDFPLFAADERAVDPQADLWEVIRRIAESEFVVGSSLHGIIVAEALGIPARAIRSTAESVFKYDDYYAGTGRWDVELAVDVEHAERLGGAPAPEWDPEPLRRAFPLDLWVPGSERSPSAAWDGGATATRIGHTLSARAHRLPRRDVVTLARTASFARATRSAGEDAAEATRALVDVAALRRAALDAEGTVRPEKERPASVVIVVDGVDDGLDGSVRSLAAVDARVVLALATGDPEARRRAAGLAATLEAVTLVDAVGLSYIDAIDAAVDVVGAETIAVARLGSRAAHLADVVDAVKRRAPLAVGRVLQFTATETWDASRGWHDGTDRDVRVSDWPESIAIRSLDGIAMSADVWRSAIGSLSADGDESAMVAACLAAAGSVALVGSVAVVRRSYTLDPPPSRHTPVRALLARRLRAEIPAAEKAAAAGGRLSAAFARTFLADRGSERLAIVLADDWADSLPALDVALCGAAAHLVSVLPAGSLDALSPELRSGLLALSRGETVEARAALTST